MAPAPDRFETDCVVIGAGVVGLAVARELALRGRAVTILERNAAFGMETSARNSEVIHAGIVYRPGSLKARLCVRGKALLYAFCDSRRVPHTRTGKLITATQDTELPRLDHVISLAEASGVTDLQPLDAKQVSELEPELRSAGAVLSPSTGTVDSHALMRALLGEAEDHGAMLALNAPVTGGRLLPDGRITLITGGAAPAELIAAHVINAGGLWAQSIARRIGGLPAPSVPGQVFAKGSYFSLTGPCPFRHLIYPAPPGDGSLGVHLTLDQAGHARFGPDIEYLDISDPSGIDYRLDPSKTPRFEAAIRRYWPGLPNGHLHADYAGCRPKLAAGNAGDIDFRIDGPEAHGLPGHVMTYGLESPALTASLAIAEHIADIALKEGSPPP